MHVLQRIWRSGVIQQGAWVKNFCPLKCLLATISSVGHFSGKALVRLSHCADDGALPDSINYLPQSINEGNWGPERFPNIRSALCTSQRHLRLATLSRASHWVRMLLTLGAGTPSWRGHSVTEYRTFNLPVSSPQNAHSSTPSRCDEKTEMQPGVSKCPNP